METRSDLGIDEIVRVVTVFRDLLVRHRGAINDLNVYPVPDGDTGTNMSLTLESVVAEIDGAGGDPVARWAAIAHGALMGARGNSGVILAALLRGIVDELAPLTVIDAASLARALTAASTAADAAVGTPVEGTILTVARETAAAATDAVAEGATLVAAIDRALAAGRTSLERTPRLLPVLADAGVVDAGGAGYLLFVWSLAHVVDGRDLPEPTDQRAPDVAGHAVVGPVAAPSIGASRYEVMFLLEAPDGAVAELKDAWDRIGDSIVVVGGDGLWNCHVHTNDIGASIEAGIAAGRPSRIRVTDLVEEVEHLEEIAAAGDATSTVHLVNPEPATTAVVAVAVGDGVQRIFESLGVHAVVRGGQSMNPSTSDLLQAVAQVDAAEVVVLPNNKNIIPVAEQVDAQSDKTVRVVPTRTVAEGFAALLAYDPGADAGENVDAMSEAAGAVVAGEVTRAVRASRTDAGAVATGDWIGLDRSGVRSIADTVVGAATGLLDVLVTADHELVTVISGLDAEPAADAAVLDWLALHRPDVDVELHSGGQPLYPYYFGIE